MTKTNIILIASAMFWGTISCQSKDEETAIKIPETPVVTTPPEQPKPVEPTPPVEPVTPEEPEVPTQPEPPEKPENPPTTNDNISQDIVGAWIRETNYAGNVGDTIVFTNDHKVEKYFNGYFNGYYEENCQMGYNLRSDTVFFSVNGAILWPSFKYFIGGSQLVIYEFTDPFTLINSIRKDVIFRKFQ